MLNFKKLELFYIVYYFYRQVPVDDANIPKGDIQETSDDNNIINSDLDNQIIPPTENNLEEVVVDNFEMETSGSSTLIAEENYKYEEMEVSEEYPYFEQDNKSIHEVNKNLSTPELITLSSDEDEEQNMSVLKSNENNLCLNQDIYNFESLSEHREIELTHCMSISKNMNEIIEQNSTPIIVNMDSPLSDNQDDSSNSDDSQLNNDVYSNSDTNSQDLDYEYLSSNDGDKDENNANIIYLDSEDEENIHSSDISSSVKSLDDSNTSIPLSDESELEQTRYGRFKSTNQSHFESVDKEESSEENMIYSDESKNINLEDDTCDGIENLNYDQVNIQYYDENEHNLKEYDTNSIEENEDVYISENKDEEEIYSTVLESNTDIITPCKFNIAEENSLVSNNYDMVDNQQVNDISIEDKNKYENNEICNTLNNTSIQIISDNLNNSAITGIEINQLKAIDESVQESTPFLFGESFFGEQISDSKPMLLFGQVYSFENEQFVTNSQDNKSETQAVNENSCKEIFMNKETGGVEIADDIQDILELESLPESEIDENVNIHKYSKLNSLKTEFKETNNSFDDNQSAVPLDNSNSSIIVISENDDVQSSPSRSNEICSPDITMKTPDILISPENDLCKKDDVLQNENIEIEKIDSINAIETKSEEFSSNMDKDNPSPSLVFQCIDNLKTGLESSTINVTNEMQNSFNKNTITRSMCIKPISSCSTIDHSNAFDNYDQILNVQSVNNTSDVFSHQNVVPDHSRTMLHSPPNVIVDISDLRNDIHSIDSILQEVNVTNEVKEVNKSPKLATIDSSIELNDTKVEKLENISNEGIQDKLLTSVKNDHIINESFNVDLHAGNMDISNNEVSYNCVEQLPLLAVNPETLQQHTTVKSPETNNVTVELENIQQSFNIDEQVSLRKNVTKLDISNSEFNDNTESTDVKISDQAEDIHEQSIQSISTLYVNEQMDENITKISKVSRAKSIPLPETNVMITRSRARSESNIIQLDTNLNIFRPSLSNHQVDDSRQTKVLLSKKLSKSQQNLVQTNRRSGRSKSLAPPEEIVTKKKTVLALEQIPEEDTLSLNKDFKMENSVITKKSKFNFGSKSKKIKSNSLSLINVSHDDTIIQNSRRSKSVQPNPVLTYSMVKTKPKQSSSVNSLQLKDKSYIEDDNFMDALKKGLPSPVKTRKRSLSESVKNKKKQKTVKNVDKVDDLDSNESTQTFYADEPLSPIAGDNMKHMLFTPAKKRTKHTTTKLNVDAENLSTDSAHIMTRSMIESSVPSKNKIKNNKVS